MKTMRQLFVMGLLTLALTACNDGFLDKKPLDQITENAVWGNINLASTYANNIYTGLPNGYYRGYYMLASSTDEADNSYQWTEVEPLTFGTYSAGDYPKLGLPWDNNYSTGLWGFNYNFIRRANIFLTRINEVPTPTDADKATKTRLVGEVKFLRALFYHELTKLYGGVPLVTEAAGTDNVDALLTARNSYDECVTFMVKELDEAIAALPDDAYQARAVKGSAQALKGRVLLYAKKWNESAVASKAVLDGAKFALFPDYGGMFLAANTGNSEIIFDNQFKVGVRTHPLDLFNTPVQFGAGGWGGTSPTQNLVDRYEMTDGKPYSESPLYSPTAPYKNREPRFYASIQYDGVLYGGKPIETRVKGISGIDGGSNGTDQDATKTGYYMRKFMDEKLLNDLNINGDTGPSYNSWVILRLGEVLLNYAEARNEATGPDAIVADAVNKVRARVKLPPLPTGLTQDQMRDRIRNERAVELAFEEHRYYDVRRWGLGEQVFNAPIFGMRISADGKKFDRFKVEDRVFKPRQNLYPIPQQEMDKNPKLVQNPGW